MKKSLSLLIETSSGRKEAMPAEPFEVISDKEVLKRAKKIKNTSEREAYLLKFVEKEPSVYLESCIHLIELIKIKNPIYAYDLAFFLSRKFSTSPITYWLIAEIANANKAWDIAISALEIAVWLSYGRYEYCLSRSEKLFNNTLKKRLKEKINNSKNPIWRDKVLDKFRTLIILFYALEKKDFFNYCLHLLEKYPKEFENYGRVYELFTKIEDPKIFEDFAIYVSENKVLPQELKAQYLGMIYYQLSDYNKSKDFLNELIKINTNNLNAKFYLSLIKLISHEFKDFLDSFEGFTVNINSSKEGINNLFRSSTPTFLGVFLIWSAINETNLDINTPDNEKEISLEITKLIKKMLEADKNKTEHLLSRFKELNYHSLLPNLSLFLSELLIKKKQFEKAKEMLKNSSHNEANRIYAWIYRIEGNEELAEEYLTKYRKELNTNEEPGIIYQMASIKKPDFIPNNEEKILKLLSNVYEQTHNLKKEFALEYGTNQNTCFESNCQECCKKTFPYVSYTEYLFLKKWLDKQPEEFKNRVLKNSLNIVKDYTKKYGREPAFLSSDVQTSTKDYPTDYTFDCPFLGEEGCLAYEVQPFICRVYGHSSPDKVQFKGCNYFQTQYELASGLTNIRKLIDISSFKNIVKEMDEKLIATSVIAPLPVWFAEHHLIATVKAKYHFLANNFKPLYNLMTKLYIKLLYKKKLL